MKTKQFKNYKMDNEVYKIRRQVIDIIYKAKKIADLPRIDVRVGDARENILGIARMNDRKIWIDVNKCKKHLTQVVLHEICHAVYGIEHNEKCDLMCAVMRPMTDKRAFDIFKQYAQ